MFVFATTMYASGQNRTRAAGHVSEQLSKYGFVRDWGLTGEQFEEQLWRCCLNLTLNVARADAGTRWASESVGRVGCANAGGPQEAAHAGGLFALCGDKTQVSADVVGVFKLPEDGFVGGGIGLETEDSFFDHLAEARADFELLPDCLYRVIAGHR